jgi:hypothetical protein
MASGRNEIRESSAPVRSNPPQAPSDCKTNCKTGHEQFENYSHKIKQLAGKMVGGRGTGIQHSLAGIRSGTDGHGEGRKSQRKGGEIPQKIRRSAGVAKALSGNTPGPNDPLLNEQRTQFARLEYFSS